MIIPHPAPQRNPFSPISPPPTKPPLSEIHITSPLRRAIKPPLSGELLNLPLQGRCRRRRRRGYRRVFHLRKNSIITFPTMPPSVSSADNRLRAIRSAALTVHRTVIHYRRLRFAYPYRGAIKPPLAGEVARRSRDGGVTVVRQLAVRGRAQDPPLQTPSAENVGEHLVCSRGRAQGPPLRKTLSLRGGTAAVAIRPLKQKNCPELSPRAVFQLVKEFAV